jgi:mannose-6-phosphate isomerase-like protein (cupin superfamily)
MDARFDQIYESEANQIFRIVFFPDRVYHARYLSATRSRRYRYNVTEVRAYSGITALKGDVYLDGQRLCGVLRLEYNPGRLTEVARQQGRRLGPRIGGWIKLVPGDATQAAEATIHMHWDQTVNAYTAEFWQTLEPPDGAKHDQRVLGLMGRDAPITRMPQFAPLLADPSVVTQVLAAFSEDDFLYPTGQALGQGDKQWDNDYRRSHQEPRDSTPSSGVNTVEDDNYDLTYRRGFFVQDAHLTAPVRYQNPLMDPDNPERSDTNIIEMRWLFQRELGAELIFFHEVTLPPGTLEGTHRHIGSEELYYIVQGTGTAYMGDGDDPALAGQPLVQRKIYGLDPAPCRQVSVQPGSIIYTKSGGIHGIHNTGTEPLRFVAFLYQTS